MHSLTQITFISFALFFVACSSTQPQYVDSRDYTSFGLDNHDIDDKVQKIAKSLLNSRTIKSQKEPKVLAIGEIDDNTSSGIDTEIIATELIKHLSDSEKFLVVNAGQDKKVEQMIRDARKMRNDAEYNQYTTIERGNLISPHYALTGKITERSKSVGEDEIREYVFVFKLTDLMRGAVRWVGTERITKKLAKSEVEYFKESKSYNSSYSNNSPYTPYTHFYGYTPSHSQNVGTERKNHFIFGADFGLGGVGINLPPVDFIIIEKGKYSNSTTPHSMWVDDLYSTHFAMPLNIRIGYLRDIGENLAFGINLLYSYMYVSSVDKYDLKTTADTIEVESDSKQLTHTFQRIGGEVLIYYKALDWLHIYVGGGMLKDFGSKYKLSFEAYRTSYFDYSINTEGQKRFELEQKIASWYPLVKFGILWNINDFIGITTDLTFSWTLKDSDYLGLYGGFIVGLQFKL